MKLGLCGSRAGRLAVSRRTCELGCCPNIALWTDLMLCAVAWGRASCAEMRQPGTAHAHPWLLTLLPIWLSFSIWTVPGRLQEVADASEHSPPVTTPHPHAALHSLWWNNW